MYCVVVAAVHADAVAADHACILFFLIRHTQPLAQEQSGSPHHLPLFSKLIKAMILEIINQVHNAEDGLISRNHV